MASPGDEEDDDDGEGQVLPFAHARVPPPQTAGSRDLGVSRLARQLGLDVEHLTGHWCRRCVGMWFGTALEAECPVCNGRGI
jgi:hypothetical protein